MRRTNDTHLLYPPPSSLAITLSTRRKVVVLQPRMSFRQVGAPQRHSKVDPSSIGSKDS